MQVLKVVQKNTFASLYAQGEFRHFYTPGSEHTAPEGFPMHVYDVSLNPESFKHFGECDCECYPRVAVLCEVEPEHFTKDIRAFGLWPLGWGESDSNPVTAMAQMLELRKRCTPEGPSFGQAGAYKLKVVGVIDLAKSTPQNIVLVQN